MLTALQLRIARLVLTSSSDPELALAGGAALISPNTVHRTTVDLDFFTTASDIEGLVAELEPALEGDGLSVRRERSAATFVRLRVTDGAEVCLVDVAQDARMRPVERGPLGRTLAPDDLAADRMLALFSRAEARDYVDVYFLAAHHTREQLCDLAREKDSGFDTAAFAEMLGAIRRLERAEFDVDETTFDRLILFFDEWHQKLGGGSH